jgi:hypothetical protein
MQTLSRLYGALAMATLVASGTAYAQAQPQPQPQPQPQGQAGQPGLTPSPSQQTCPEDVAPENCPVAQGEAGTATTSTTTTTTSTATAPAYAPPAEHYEPWYMRMGFGLSLGGGVSDFVGDAARATTNIGGDWTVRGTWGTRSWLALELAYMGSAQSVDAIGLDNNAVLVGNGVTGDVRFNVLPRFIAQPFLYGGAAWRHYDVTNTNINVSDVNNTDDVFEVPVGIGLAGYIYGFMADVRGEYRMAWGNDLIPSIAGENNGSLIGSLDRWNVTGTLGMAF